MIYLLKDFKKSFIKIFKNFFKEEEGNAASIFVIFTSTIILLISLLLFFIYGWEMNLLREEISDIVVREIYSGSVMKNKLAPVSYEYKKELENSIENKIKNRFIDSYQKNGMLKNLGNKYLYYTGENYLNVQLNILNTERDENFILVKVRIELKFVFPILFLMNYVKNDIFEDKRNVNPQVKKRVNFTFEEIYTIY